MTECVFDGTVLFTPWWVYLLTYIVKIVALRGLNIVIVMIHTSHSPYRHGDTQNVELELGR